MIDHAWQLYSEKHVRARSIDGSLQAFLARTIPAPCNVVINQNLRNPTESIPPATVFLQAAGIDGFDGIWSGIPGSTQMPGNRDFVYLA